MPFLKKKSTNDTSTRKNPMAEIIPISCVEDDYFQRKDGYYCATLAVTPVNMDLLANDECDRVVEALQEAANTAPERIHILCSSERLNLDDYMAYLKGFIDQAEDADQLERIDSMIQFIRSRSVKSEKVMKFYLTIQSQHEKVGPALNELEDLTRQITDILKNESMYTYRLQKKDLLALWYQKLNPNTSLYEPATSNMELSDIYPAIIDTKSSHFFYIVDETYHKSFTIVSFPTERPAAWLSPILQMPIDMDVSLTLSVTDKDVVLDRLNSSLKEISSKLSDEKTKKDRLLSKKLKREEEDGDQVLDHLTNDNESLFRTTIVLTIRAKSLDELINAEKSLRVKISSKQMRYRPLVRWAFQPLWYTLPLCYRGPMEDHIHYNLPAHVIASMQPFNSSTLAAKDGLVLGINEQSHDLVILGSEDRARYPHTIMLGETGSGKSYSLHGLTLRKLDQGEIVIDIDPERERTTIPGNHIYFGLNHPYTVNVFHIRSTVVDTDNERLDDSTKAGDYLRLKIDRNESFFRWIYPELNALEAAAIEQAQVEAYKKYNLTFESTHLPATFPTLGEFLDVLQGIQGTDKVCLALRPYVKGGTLSRMFDGQTNWGFTERRTLMKDGRPVEVDAILPYTRLDIHELPQRAQAPLMDLLLNDIWEFVKQDRTIKKNLHIDEAWIVADPERPHTLNFIFEMVKRGRKYGVYMTTATQNVGDFLRTRQGVAIAPGQAIISNSGVKVLLHLDDKEIETIAQFVTLSDKEKKVLRAKGARGHGIVLVGTQHAELQTFMTPAELKNYDPKRYELLYLEEA